MPYDFTGKISHLSLKEVLAQNRIYIQIGNLSEDAFYTDTFVSKEIIPITKLKKDYYQELNTMGYKGEYGLSQLSSYEEHGKLILEQNGEKYSPVSMNVVDRETVNLFIDAGIENLICHPDWEVKTVNIYYKLPNRIGYGIIILHSDVQQMQRYLFAFIISTTHEYFSIDKCGAQSVSVPPLNTHKMDFTCKTMEDLSTFLKWNPTAGGQLASESFSKTDDNVVSIESENYSCQIAYSVYLEFIKLITEN